MDYYCNNLGTIIGETYQTEMESRIIKTDKAIHYIRRSYRAAWYVNMEMGFVSSNDFSSFYFARGVCSPD